jgi:hypothetical protein
MLDMLIVIYIIWYNITYFNTILILFDLYANSLLNVSLNFFNFFLNVLKCIQCTLDLKQLFLFILNKSHTKLSGYVIKLLSQWNIKPFAFKIALKIFEISKIKWFIQFFSVFETFFLRNKKSISWRILLEKILKKPIIYYIIVLLKQFPL